MKMRRAFPSIWFALYLNGMFLFIYFGKGIFSGFLTIGVVTLCGLSTLVYARTSICKTLKNKCVLYVVLFAIYLSLSLIWTSASTYGAFKVRGFWLGAVIPFISLLILLDKNPLILKKIEKISLIFGLLASIILIVSSGGSFGNRNSIEGMNSIWNARDIGIGSIVCYYYFFTKKNNYNIKLIGLPVMLVLLAGMLFNASRGPIAALSSAILFLELSSFTKIKNQYFKGLKFTYLMLLSIIILVTAFSTSSRLNISYMIDDKNVQDRVKLYSSSFEIVTTKPIFGTGIGGFSVAYKGNDARIYTHNFLLEILIELGIVGLLFTLVIFRFFIRDRKLLLSNDSGVVWTAFFIFFLVNAMFSGDLFGNAIMWLPGAGMIKVKESLIMKKEEMKKNRNLNLRQYTER